MMKHHVVWFDIPARDLDRAIAFYSAVLSIEIMKYSEPKPLGVLAHEGDQVAGCIYEGGDLQPSEHGILLYFNVDGRLDDAVESVRESGGKILKPKHSIGMHGWRAIVLDSEGNRIALHSE